MYSRGFCALGILVTIAFAIGCEGEHLQNTAVWCSEKQLRFHLQSRKFSDVWYILGFSFSFCVQIWLLSYDKIL